MRKTFVCDETMIITIPIGSLRNAREDELMPDRFHCVFKDFYKLFVVRGKPKPSGVSVTVCRWTAVVLCFLYQHYFPLLLFVDRQPKLLLVCFFSRLV